MTSLWLLPIKINSLLNLRHVAGHGGLLVKLRVPGPHGVCNAGAFSSDHDRRRVTLHVKPCIVRVIVVCLCEWWRHNPRIVCVACLCHGSLRLLWYKPYMVLSLGGRHGRQVFIRRHDFTLHVLLEPMHRGLLVRLHLLPVR